ncbi:hypothetical protein LguiA_000688 [Lonicera macranthoides]
MKTKHPSFSLLSFLSTIFLFHHHHSISATAIPAPVPAPGPAVTNDTEFIRTSCSTTLYPDLCYNSLSGYASTIQQDPARLASLAIDLSLTKAKRMASYVSNLCRQSDYGRDRRVAAALHDCFTVFGDAVDQICRSLKQMRHLGGSGESLRFQLSNVQTYMSAALTNEDTCADGFEDLASGVVKTEVCGRVVPVRQLTSNALALVNNFVAKITAH